MIPIEAAPINDAMRDTHAVTIMDVEQLGGAMIEQLGGLFKEQG